MNQRHKHADLIIAWANGAEVEYKCAPYGAWITAKKPGWEPYIEYRIKQHLPKDFIAYNGDGCPVDGDCSVQVIFRSGICGYGTGLARQWSWKHEDHNYDIIGYRVIGKKSPVVRWQWIVRWGSCALPIIPNVFYTEDEIKSDYKNEPATIIGKAEWTRMEFEE